MANWIKKTLWREYQELVLWLIGIGLIIALALRGLGVI